MTRSIGYVGLDHHHREPYLQSIAQLDAEVTAVADSEYAPEDVGADGLTDLPAYRDVTTLIEEENVDLLWITLSNDSAPDAIRAAVSRDVDVFTEKPAARTAADFEPVVDAVESSDATVGLSYTWRGHPFSAKLRQLLQDGFFGNVRSFDARFVASNLNTRRTDHYLFDRTASRGGIVQWLGVHWIDLLAWILDDPIVSVNARMQSETPGVDVEDGSTLQFETASGTVGSHTCGYFLSEGRYDTEVKIYGDEGAVSWDPMGPTFGFDGETSLTLSPTTDGDSQGETQLVHEYEDVPGYGGHWGLSYFQQFLSACRGTARNPAGVRDALQVLRVLDAAYESDRTNGWVSVKGTDSV